MTDKERWLQELASADTPSKVVEAIKRVTEKPSTLAPKFQKDSGPMMFFGQKVAYAMTRIGEPTKVHCCFRSPEVQQLRKNSGNSKAKPWSSPHQFYEAVDLIHVKRGWPPTSDPYWDKLADVALNVADDLGLDVVSAHREWGWDSAHFELRGWRDWRAVLFERHGRHQKPSEAELFERFRQVLPQVDLGHRDTVDHFQRVDELVQAANERVSLSERAQGALERMLRDMFDGGD